MFYENAMKPAAVYRFPDRADFLPSGRHWQGIASIERTEKGRLFTVFYSGGVTEQCGNFITVALSDDDGQSWTDPLICIQHEDTENMRVFDPNLWIDPLGRLWITYAQSYQYTDGRCGVWAVRWDRPDDPVEEMILTAPRRLANGIMMNKPTVLSDGTWLLPCAIWACGTPAEDHPELQYERKSNVYASTDNGESFVYRGSADVPNRNCDEHMVYEKRDGSLRMFVRRYDGIGEAYSYDHGRTWWQEGHSGIAGPCTRFYVRRLLSGNLLLIYHFDAHNQIRNNLMAKLSFDDGQTWQGGLMLDARDNVSYPDACQAPDGRIYAAYDHERYKDREVLMAVFTEHDILAGKPVSEGTRLRVPVSKASGLLPEELKKE